MSYTLSIATRETRDLVVESLRAAADQRTRVARGAARQVATLEGTVHRAISEEAVVGVVAQEPPPTDRVATTGHRIPYVGDGADGARRSAAIGALRGDQAPPDCQHTASLVNRNPEHYAPIWPGVAPIATDGSDEFLWLYASQLGEYVGRHPGLVA